MFCADLYDYTKFAKKLSVENLLMTDLFLSYITSRILLIRRRDFYSIDSYS